MIPIIGFQQLPIISNGLVLYLNASDRTSYVTGSLAWRDLSGNENGGILGNGTTFNSANGGAIVFDGTNDIVSGSNNTSVQLIGDLTMMAWINVTDFVNFNGILSKTNSNIPNPYDYYLSATTGRPNLLRGNGTTFAQFTATAAPTTGTWQNVAVTMRGTTVTHYLNGVANGSGTLSTFITNGAVNVAIGNRNDIGTPFKGRIASVFLYNRSLSAQEIQQNYNSTRVRF